MSGSVRERLRRVLGDRGFIEDPERIAPRLVEWRDRFQGATFGVALPATTAEVAAVLELCHEARVAVVPQGGNTGLCGGAIPDRSGRELLLGLDRLDRIRALDARGYTVTAEAGCVLARLQRAAAEVDRLFALSLAAEDSCQLGGCLSTNAGGTNVLRYGTARDQVLGLEVVLPDGRVLDLLRALRKDTGGYDLKQCFIGAEGTLGVITAACCRLHPAPRGFGTAFAAVPDADAALDLLGELRHRSGDALTGFELIPAIGLEMVVRHVPGVRPPLDPQTAPWYALIELTSFDSPADAEERLVAGLEAATGRGWVIDAAVAAGEGQRQAFWKLRDAMSAAQKREGASIKHDVSVPLSRLAEFIRDGESLVAERVPGARLVAFGHVGDGNVHFNVSEPVGGDRAAFLAVRENLTAAVHDLVARYGGSFSAEHGVGQLKNAELARYRSPAELALMRSLKAMFDPDGIMNPGKVLPAG